MEIADVLVVIGMVLGVLNLPGLFLIALGVFIGEGFGWLFVIFALIAIAGTFIDNIFGVLGAKKYGSSNWGLVGVVLGVIVGLLTANIFAVFLAPLAFAYLFEMFFAKKDSNDAFNAAKGAVLGTLAGYAAKAAITLILGIVYLVSF